MSAVLQQRYDRYAMAGMRALLRKWGAICEQARNWNGYPSMDTTYRARLGPGYGRRLPICEVPSFAVQLSREVMKLPDDESNAVTIWYCHTFNFAGQWLSTRDKALLLGICEDTLRCRERAGRERLLFTAKHIMEAVE
jgi:hypothetical protein